MKPTVSIVIPVYNSEEFLAETIESVRRQSFKSFEIIVVDNCSTKKETIEFIANLPEDIRKVKSTEKGLSAARNDGIKTANGSYILPLDSDDLIEPSFLQKFVAVIDKYPSVTVVRSSIELIGKKKGIIHFADYELPTLLARNLMVASSLFRKSDWEKVGGYDTQLVDCFEDWEFWINLLKEGGKVSTISEPLFKYRIRKRSMMHSLKIQHLKKARKYIWEKHKNLYATHFVDPTETFEYKLLEDSLANKIGSKLLAPFSRFKLMKG